MTPDEHEREIGDCRDCHQPVVIGPWGAEGDGFGGFVDEDERRDVAHFECKSTDPVGATPQLKGETHGTLQKS